MKRFFNLIFIALAAFSVMSCDLSDKFDGLKNSAESILNDAIQKLESQSASWQTVLKDAQDKLTKDAQSTLANEVSNIASRAASDIGIEAKCFVDFLRDRVREDLIRLRATITKEVLVLKPVFCNPTPNIIDMNIDISRRPVLEIAGYNLTVGSLKVFLENTGGRIDVSQHLSSPSSYLLTLNIGSNGAPLGATSNKIVFELPGGQQKTVSIIQPPAPQPKPVYDLRNVSINGNVYLNDKEFILSDENRTVAVNRLIPVSSASGGTYNFSECVGDEVHGYIDIRMILNRDTGTVSVSGTTRYYEGTECGETDLQGKQLFNFTLPLNQSFNLQHTLSDSDGGVTVDLTFRN